MGSILIGLIPALGWGFQGIVMQKIGGTTANKQMGMVLTALVMSIFVALVDPIVWSPALIAAAAVNGIPWAIAQILQIKSFDYLGVSRAMPLTAGMQLILTSIIGAFYFGEWPQAWQMGVGFAGIALIIVGTVLTTYTEAGQETTSKEYIRKGVIITAISSVLYVAYATAARFFNVDSFQILLPQALFMLAATVVIAIFVSKRDSVDGVFGRTEGVFGLKSWQNMLTGVLWSVANIAVLFSNQVNGVAVGWTLANMNLIFATLGGLFILHEKKTPKELRFVIAGMVLIAAGGIAIGATKLG
jgi:glucose uptake protein